MLITPAALPDEIDRGYLGRVMRINGVTNEREISVQMAEHVGMGDLPRREAPCVVLLSKVANVQVTEFVRQHTMLPLRRGITSYQPDLKHGCESNPSMLWTSAMRVARPGGYFCRDCVKEDEEFHGLSYWRRDHQIPGLLWCQKHKTRLHYRDSADAFLAAPSQFVDDCHTISEPWVKEAFNNQVVQRFLDISSDLIGRAAPFSVKRVSAVLKARAASRGFQTYSGSAKAPLLSDAVVGQFGREWLATVLPALADKQEGTILNSMDGVLYLANSASSVTAYILALSILFETPEDALNAIIWFEDVGPTKRHRTLAKAIKPEELRLAYMESRGNYSATANSLGVSYAAVRKPLLSMGLPNLTGANGHDLEKAVAAFFLEGRSLEDSAAVGKISRKVMEELVRTTGSAFGNVLHEMQGQRTGRGTGIRRPLQLPHEVNLNKGRMEGQIQP